MQVSIYFPEQQHPRYGVVRAVVKDTSTESNSSSTAGQMVYLDSDDLVADNVNTPILPGANPMADGKWHMVTVTTQPDMSTGFLLFLDGVEVGDMLQGSYTGALAYDQANGCKLCLLGDFSVRRLHVQHNVRFNRLAYTRRL